MTKIECDRSGSCIHSISGVGYAAPPGRLRKEGGRRRASDRRRTNCRDALMASNSSLTGRVIHRKAFLRGGNSDKIVRFTAICSGTAVSANPRAEDGTFSQPRLRADRVRELCLVASPDAASAPALRPQPPGSLRASCALLCVSRFSSQRFHYRRLACRTRGGGRFFGIAPESDVGGERSRAESPARDDLPAGASGPALHTLCIPNEF